MKKSWANLNSMKYLNVEYTSGKTLQFDIMWGCIIDELEYYEKRVNDPDSPVVRVWLSK